MQRTLLVDTNRAAYPIYQALLAAGHEVWVVGGNPSEPLAKMAANYVQLNYSDADQLARLVDDKGFDWLVPGCTDLSYEVCARINPGRFPGIETPANTAAINTKSEFRNVAADNALPIPRVLDISDAENVPAVIIKPVDSFSGRGMTVLYEPSPTQLAASFETACRTSKQGDAIIEEFVCGQLYSHSAFIHSGEIVADFVVQEDSVACPFAVDTSRIAPTFPPQILDALRDDVRRLAAKLDLLDGLVHTQLIVGDNDRYWIIEMTRRCPGDIYSLLIEFSTGYPYAASYVAPFIGHEVAPPDPDAVRERIIRHTASPKTPESLWGFSFSEPVNIRLFVPMATSGTQLGPGPLGRAGIFFFCVSSEQEEDTLYRTLLADELYSFG